MILPSPVGALLAAPTACCAHCLLWLLLAVAAACRAIRGRAIAALTILSHLYDPITEDLLRASSTEKTSRRFLRELVTSEHETCGRLAAGFTDSIGSGNQPSVVGYQLLTG